MYSLSGFAKMISGSVRMEAYLAALRQAVRPDSVVVDLGCGPGLFALQACRLGARKVYAIEPGASISLARELAAANGYARQIEFRAEFSTALTLPEKADVIIADLRGILPHFQSALASLADARRRMLRPGGVMIPLSDTIWGAVVHSPAAYARHLAPWDPPGWGFNLQAARKMSANTIYQIHARPEELLAHPAPLATLDYTADNPSRFDVQHCWIARRSGEAHGLCLWFDSVLAPGVEMSNAPGRPELIYGNALLPFSTPLAIEPGDKLEIRVQADLVGADYVWRWDTSHNGSPLVRQSTFFGAPVPLDALKKLR